MKRFYLFAICVVLIHSSFAQDAFITTWATTEVDESIFITTNSSGDYTYDYDIDWGDGNSESGLSGNASHSYSSAGTYTVTITGEFPAFLFGNSGANLMTLEQWGTISWQTMRSAFFDCANLVINATDNPDLSSVNDMSYMFYDATEFNSDISSWDVSNVTDMSYMFVNATAFNIDISSWDVSNVTNMSSMFYNADSFVQDLNGWDVGNVTDMSRMFSNTESFNGSISDWDVSSVDDMSSMFSYTTSFNGDLSSWDVSKVTDMSTIFNSASAYNQEMADWDVSQVTDMTNMFRSATVFDQDISAWDVSNVTTMLFMFHSASIFNQDLSEWNVSQVTNMSNMFFRARAFDQDISQWDVSSVTDMSGMFGVAEAFNQDISQWDVGSVNNMSKMFSTASSFNQSISDWDVSGVTNMSSMFYGASAFNQELSSWDVSSVTNMSSMFAYNTSFNQSLIDWDVSQVTDMQSFFEGATSFDQDISDWNVSNVTSMSAMLSESAFSTENYEKLLEDWSELTLQPSVLFSVDASYCSAKEERAKIESDFGWTIADDGQNCYPILTNLIISENEEVGTLVGSLSTADEDESSTYTYETSGTNADHFDISDDQLLSNLSFNFESQHQYALTIISTDQDGKTADADFIIEITDENESPTEISLSSTDIDERLSTNTVVGTIGAADEDISDSHTYLVSGIHASHFDISGDDLVTNDIFDFENQSSYTITLTAQDEEGETYAEDFEITINDTNDPSTGISLTSDINNLLEENTPAGTIIGVLSTMDQDTEDSYVYSVSGDFANSFEIIGDELLTLEVFDYETLTLDSELSVDLNVTIISEDSEGLIYSEEIPITIKDINEAPEVILLSNYEIQENLPIGEVIGSLSTQDQDLQDEHTYSLSGDDASDFDVVGTDLVSTIIFDFESQSNYQVTVTSTDLGGASLSQVVTIEIIDELDEPISLSIDDLHEVQIYPNPVQHKLHVDSDGPISIVMFGLDGQSVLTSEENFIDTSGLAKGIYLVRVLHGNREKMVKVLKE